MKYLDRIIFAALSIGIACQVACRLTGSDDGEQYKNKKICKCFYIIPFKELNRKPFFYNIDSSKKNESNEQDNREFHNYD